MRRESRAAASIRRSFVAALVLFAAGVVFETEPRAFAQEPQVCPYQLYPGSWLNTGFEVRAGQTLEIQATGTNRYKDGARVEFGPGGDMYSVWSLTVKVGSEITDLDGGSSYTATQSGVVELGTPAKATTPIEEGAQYLDTGYSLCVSIRLADEGGGGLSAALEDCPAEIWVDYGRPSMACTICIRGFRTNTSDPVVVDCPDAFDEWGDHEDPGGNPLKLVRIFACGAQAATYDWAGRNCADGSPGYPWGIFVSAPRQDLENYQQPGRRNPICVGTNPVRLRVSQGEDSVELFVAPQIVLQAGLVGGGGSYENVTECDEDGGAGGGGGGGGVAGGCGLGRWWEERENIWLGTWTRRGGSSVFDGHWETPGYPPIDQILTVSTYQNQVHIFREGPNAANNCEYDGTLSPDGRTVSGSYSCNDRGNVIGPVSWSATIHCD